MSQKKKVEPKYKMVLSQDDISNLLSAIWMAKNEGGDFTKLRERLERSYEICTNKKWSRR